MVQPEERCKPPATGLLSASTMRARKTRARDASDDESARPPPALRSRTRRGDTPLGTVTTFDSVLEPGRCWGIDNLPDGRVVFVYGRWDGNKRLYRREPDGSLTTSWRLKGRLPILVYNPSSINFIVHRLLHSTAVIWGTSVSERRKSPRRLMARSMSLEIVVLDLRTIELAVSMKSSRSPGAPRGATR